MRISVHRFRTAIGWGAVKRVESSHWFVISSSNILVRKERLNCSDESAAADPPVLNDPPFVVDLTNRQFQLVTIVGGGFKDPIPTLGYIGPLAGNNSVHEAERFGYAELANLTIPPAQVAVVICQLVVASNKKWSVGSKFVEARPVA